MNIENSNFRRIPVGDWAKGIQIEWDFDLKNPVYNPFENEEWFSEDILTAGWVNLNELFFAIPKTHQLNGDEIWEERDEDKINRAILYWKKGGKMTPILISFLEEYGMNRVVMHAGFHRFSVCCLLQLDQIPFFTPVSSKEQIEKRLKTVRWI